MSYSVTLPTFQVETAMGNNIFYDLKTATEDYEQKCERNIPTELYEDGVKIKEDKPIF